MELAQAPDAASIRDIVDRTLIAGDAVVWDRPLTVRQMAETRSRSAVALITPGRAALFLSRFSATVAL